MSWYKRTLNETVTYWEPGTPDGYGGYDYADPVKLDGRWEDHYDLYLDDRGEERRAEGNVFLVDDVKVEGMLYRGDSNASDPTTVDGAKEVKQVKRVKSLSKRTEVIKVWLGT